MKRKYDSSSSSTICVSSSWLLLCHALVSHPCCSAWFWNTLHHLVYDAHVPAALLIITKSRCSCSSICSLFHFAGASLAGPLRCSISGSYEPSKPMCSCPRNAPRPLSLTLLGCGAEFFASFLIALHDTVDLSFLPAVRALCFATAFFLVPRPASCLLLIFFHSDMKIFSIDDVMFAACSRLVCSFGSVRGSASSPWPAALPLCAR